MKSSGSASETPSGVDSDSIQSGDQTTPDAQGAAAAQETSGEQPGSESSVSDGPGGHEDPPGTEADHQFEGEEYEPCEPQPCRG